MNLFEARQILELDINGNYTDSDIKKKFRILAMKYHPDKCNGNGNGISNDGNDSSTEKFIKINSAYGYLSNFNNTSPDFLINNIKEKLFKSNDLGNIFKNFVNGINKPIFTDKKELKKIIITPKEYFTGTEKIVKGECKCEKKLCINCAGCGFSTNFNTCNECLGEGWITECNNNYCNIRKIVIPKYINLDVPYQKEFKIILDDPLYFFENGNIYYSFDISLKDSLIGFNKIFKDPFEVEHSIIVNTIIKQNDGYSIKICGKYNLILLFNVIYPKKFSKEVIQELKKLTF